MEQKHDREADGSQIVAYSILIHSVPEPFALLAGEHVVSDDALRVRVVLLRADL